MAMRKLFIESRGGLGNQLFSYFYGIRLANSRGLSVEIVTVDNHHANSNLDSINFIESSLVIPKVNKSKSRIILVKLCLFLRNRVLHSSSWNYPYTPNPNKSEVEKCISLNSLVVTGYFADFSYYDSLGISGANLCVLKPSVEYLNYISIFGKKRFIAFHIRYGDFLHSEISDGVLCSDYYFQALKVIDNEFREELEIVIFCDQPGFIDEVFLDSKRISIFESDGLSAFEVMKVMGSATAMVLCLSTFGFWSAKLSTNNPIVIYPSCNISGQILIEGTPTNWVAQDPPWKI